MSYHPKFASQYETLATRAEGADYLMALFGEISALLRALEDLGHEIEGDQPEDASHPIVISRFQTFDAPNQLHPLRLCPADPAHPLCLVRRDRWRAGRGGDADR